MTSEPALKFGPTMDVLNKNKQKPPSPTELAYLGCLQAVFAGFGFGNLFLGEDIFAYISFIGQL